MTEFNEFIKLVAGMRTAQQNYFKASAKARKTKHPDDFATSKYWLNESKAFEAAVDLIILKYPNS